MSYRNSSRMSDFDTKLLIRGLKPRYSIVIVTHNLAQARRISDRAIFMLDGEIIEQTSTEKIFMNPHLNLTRDFIWGKIG